MHEDLHLDARFLPSKAPVEWSTPTHFIGMTLDHFWDYPFYEVDDRNCHLALLDDLKILRYWRWIYPRENL